MSTVSIIKCRKYDYEIVKEAVSTAINLLGGIEQFVKQNAIVLLKPNLISDKSPAAAATTHPTVMKAVAELVIEAGGRPFIADSPGAIHAGLKKKILENTGMKQVADELGIKSVIFDTGGFEEINLPKGKNLEKVFVARDVLFADVVINMPKVKSHTQAYYTGAVKNMFGIIPGKDRAKAHRIAKFDLFSQMLVDIYTARIPDLTIMDGVVGMEGNGPTWGTPAKLGLILASSDGVALDAVCLKLIEYDINQVLNVYYAGRRKIGETDLAKIKILGEKNIEKSKRKFKKPPLFYINLPHVLDKIVGEFFNEMWKSKPVISKEKCTGCKICLESCPKDAIDFCVTNGNKKYCKIDSTYCIECFCCYEVCPNEAIYVKRKPMAELMRLLGI